MEEEASQSEDSNSVTHEPESKWFNKSEALKCVFYSLHELICFFLHLFAVNQIKLLTICLN